MYIFFSIFLVLALLCSIIFHFRKKKLICKVYTMCACEKYQILNNAIKPFGFHYDLAQDVFSSRLDAFQREFGYGSIYDRGAAFFNMSFDCEPIYFDYDGKTWLIEFWKGQYGINIGGELGIYYADGLVPVNKRATTIFSAVSDDELFPVALQLFYHNKPLYYIEQDHWWLTGFSMGRFAKPEELSLKLAIAFPCEDMLFAFSAALTDIGYTENDFYTVGLKLYLYFDIPKRVCPCRKHRFFSWLSRVENRIFCKLFLTVTKPFTDNMDRLLLLYFFIPFAFRRMCSPRVFKRKKRRVRK